MPESTMGEVSSADMVVAEGGEVLGERGGTGLAVGRGVVRWWCGYSSEGQLAIEGQQ